MQTDTELLLEALSQPPSAILLWLGHRLRRRFAGRAVVEVNIDTVTDRETITERLIDPNARDSLM